MTDWPEWPVGELAKIDDPGARGFEVGGGTWPFRGFVVRRNGELRAFANICPHLSYPLDMLPDEFFAQEGRVLRCMSHGALFDPESGFCIVGPCAGQSLLQLECRVDEGQIRVRAPATLQEGIELIRSAGGAK
jgi:nitrite reductase/ring-hydroxylating ferredoxin subunit